MAELMDTTPDPPPHTVRIKRKRDEAPLSALFLEERKISKRTRPNGYMFKLAGTFEQEPAVQANILLESEPNAATSRVFRLPKSRKLSSSRAEQVPHEDLETSQNLTDMVHSYLELDQQQQQQTASSALDHHHHHISSSPIRPGRIIPDTTTSADAEIEEYVYDIYYRERMPAGQAPPDLDQATVGLIMLDSDDEIVAHGADDDSVHLSDDEDSNAEDYFGNDYPDEEDHSDRYGGGGDGDSSSSEFEVDDDDYRGERVPDEVREGRWYMGDLKNQDDSDEYNDYSDGGGDENLHSPRNEEVEEERWSIDEDYDQYRDRIIGELESKLAEHS